MQNIKHFLANLSHHPGVYQMLDQDGQVIYVGKARDLKKRVASYFSSKSRDQKTLTLIEQIADIDITVTTSENEAVLLECNLIKKHRPRYNVLLRDDKSYPYILITTQDDYPRIDFYRGRKRSGRYFGPYPSAYAVRETISLLQKLFKIRTCRDHYFRTRLRPCLLYQINRCTGPCVELIAKEAYALNVQNAILFLEGKGDQVIDVLQDKMEVAAKSQQYEVAAQFRDQILRLRSIQNKQYINVDTGNADIIGFAQQAGITCLQLLTLRDGQMLGSRSYFPKVPAHASMAEILSAFITQHYLHDTSHIESIPQEVITDIKPLDQDLIKEVLAEQAKHKVTISHSVRGEKRKWLEMAMTSAKQSLSIHHFNKTNLDERMGALQSRLQLDKPPNRVECFDISHSSGEATVASCVVFDHAGPVKSNYRRFNISHITPGDDVAAMRQVIHRRFKRLQKDAAPLPDVVLIDGGPTQLNAAASVLEELNVEGVLLVGVSKGPDRKAGFESLHRFDHGPIHLPEDDLALHFIQQIRDEAHRFAITGHRQRRDKARRQSTLELIPGIGAKRRREILRYFGGIQGVLHASLEELTQVPGINRSLAERIFATLHDATL